MMLVLPSHPNHELELKHQCFSFHANKKKRWHTLQERCNPINPARRLRTDRSSTTTPPSLINGVHIQTPYGRNLPRSQPPLSPLSHRVEQVRRLHGYMIRWLLLLLPPSRLPFQLSSLCRHPQLCFRIQDSPPSPRWLPVSGYQAQGTNDGLN